jgi:hydrogenase expression/formation protein HypC
MSLAGYAPTGLQVLMRVNKERARAGHIGRDCSKEGAMCLAIPMRVLEIDGLMARCEAKGVERTVGLFLLQRESIVPGDQLLIHGGYAIQKVSQDEARSAWALFDEMLAASDGEARADRIEAARCCRKHGGSSIASDFVVAAGDAFDRIEQDPAIDSPVWRDTPGV